MLRSILIIVLVLGGAAMVTAQEAPADTAAAATRDPWYVRNIYRWFVQHDPSVPALTPHDGWRAEDPFLPFAGRTIREVRIRGRKAFGEVVPDSARGPDWLLGAARLTTSPLEGLLNDLYTGTRQGVVAGYLLFQPGEVLDPFALADSERLLREAGFAKDVRIEVFPADPETTQVDVVVLERDRWPYGADLKVHDTNWFDSTVFHRNLLGFGLDFETKIRYRDDRTPNPGYVAQLRAPNLQGTFIDAAVLAQDTWDRDEWRATAVREFRYPGVHFVGGLALAEVTDRSQAEELATDLAWREAKAWFGHAWVVSHDQIGDRPRQRLVAAAGVDGRHYEVRPPSRPGEPPRFPHATRYLANITLVGWKNYRTNLVRGFGETEDIPTGLWLSLIGGWEADEVAERLYHGASLLVPAYSAHGRYLTGRLAFGGYSREARIEDGVVQAQLGGFSALEYWIGVPCRHSFAIGYTRGLNRRLRGGLSLDGLEGVRGFDAVDVLGDERLRGGIESVAFLPPSLLGFKFAAFAFADGGFIGPGDEPLLAGPLYASVGAGVRIKNPGLVFRTLQIRIAHIRDGEDWRTELAVQSDGDSFFDFLVPGVEPAVLPYR